MQTGSALARGPKASTALVEQAVATALRRGGIRAHDISCLLLFLTEDFLPLLTEALQCAMRTTSSLQVHGCTGAGVLVENDWVLDAPAAAAMAFHGPVLQRPANDAARIVLADLAQGLNTNWLKAAPARYGTIAARRWYAGRLLSATDSPLEMTFNTVTLHCSAPASLPSPPAPPEFGMLFPSLPRCLDPQGIETCLAGIRSACPGMPLIGILPGSTGQIGPSQSGDNVISPEIEFLLTGHHV